MATYDWEAIAKDLAELSINNVNPLIKNIPEIGKIMITLTSIAKELPERRMECLEAQRVLYEQSSYLIKLQEHQQKEQALLEIMNLAPKELH